MLRNTRKKQRSQISYSDIITRFRLIDEFIRGKILLDSLLESKKSRDGKFSADWPELLFMRRNLRRLAIFLLMLPIRVRCMVIMRVELLGFSRNYLFYNYSVQFDKMTAFTNTNSDAGMVKDEKARSNIRKLIPKENYPLEFIAFIALAARIPMQWLRLEKPESKWSTEHFGLLRDVILLSREPIISFLNQMDPNIHDLRGVILYSDKLKDPLYLRVENLFGSITIELCNENCSTLEYQQFEKLFKQMEIIQGYMPTVVRNQINHAAIYKHPGSNRPLSYPIEFEERS